MFSLSRKSKQVLACACLFVAVCLFYHSEGDFIGIGVIKARVFTLGTFLKAWKWPRTCKLFFFEARLSSRHHHGQCRALLSSRRLLFTPVSLGTLANKKSWIGHRFRDLGVPLKMKLSIFTCNPLATYKPATPLGQPLLITSYYVRIMPNIFWIGLGNNRWLQRTATTREVLLYFWSTAEYTKATTNGVDNAMSIVDTKSTNSSWQ